MGMSLNEKVLRIPNALPHRNNMELVICGMDGIPPRDLEEYALRNQPEVTKKSKIDAETPGSLYADVPALVSMMNPALDARSSAYLQPGFVPPFPGFPPFPPPPGAFFPPPGMPPGMMSMRPTTSSSAARLSGASTSCCSARALDGLRAVVSAV